MQEATPPESDANRAKLSVLKIIHLAMTMGGAMILTVLCVFFFVVHKQKPLLNLNFPVPVLAMAVGGWLILAYALCQTLIPALLQKRYAAQRAAAPAGDTRTAVWAAYQETFFIRLGLLESAVALSGIALLLEGHVMAIGVGVGAILLLLTQAPSRETIEETHSRLTGVPRSD
jgi:hypothetical protein